MRRGDEESTAVNEHKSSEYYVNLKLQKGAIVGLRIINGGTESIGDLAER